MKYGDNLNYIKAITYLENCYLKELLEDPNITDISFNGDSIYYVHNFLGRKKADFEFTNEMAKDFLRQLANLCEKQFSFQNPLLNLSIGKYRLNGVFNSIGRYKNNKVFTFSLRISSSEPKITKDSNFLTLELIELFNALIENNVSIIISGVTGSGKTELQKFLISTLKENTRVVVIDEVLELDNLNNSNYLDLSIWQVDSLTNIQELVKNALRSNPDWLIVSESRGEEMLDVLNSSMTGHPIITTIHSYDIESIPSRAVGMIMMSDKKFTYEKVLKDFIHHIKIGIYVKKRVNDLGEIERYISGVAEFLEEGQINYIYKRNKDQHEYFFISDTLLKLFDEDKLSELFKKTFIRKGDI